MRTMFCIDKGSHDKIVEHEEVIIPEVVVHPWLKTIECFWKLRKSLWGIMKLSLRKDALYFWGDAHLNEYDEDGIRRCCFIYKEDESLWYDFYEKKCDPF